MENNWQIMADCKFVVGYDSRNGFFEFVWCVAPEQSNNNDNSNSSHFYGHILLIVKTESLKSEATSEAGKGTFQYVSILSFKKCLVNAAVKYWNCCLSVRFVLNSPAHEDVYRLCYFSFFFFFLIRKPWKPWKASVNNYRCSLRGWSLPAYYRCCYLFRMRCSWQKVG